MQNIKQSYWAGEICKKCFHRNVIGFIVDDDIWDKVSDNKWNILCATCFDEEAEKKGVSYVFKGVFPVSWNMWLADK